MPMEQNEYKFPDEVEDTKAQVEDEEEEFVVEIDDDTPEEDRGKEPLPPEVVTSLEKPEDGGEYPEEVVSRFKQYKKAWHDERREKEKALREQEEALRIAQSILEENQRLKATLTSGEQEYIATVKAAAETDVEVAKRNYREAYDLGDAEKLVEAQAALVQATLNPLYKNLKLRYNSRKSGRNKSLPTQSSQIGSAVTLIGSIRTRR
jgi:hypothetical protein